MLSASIVTYSSSLADLLRSIGRTQTSWITDVGQPARYFSDPRAGRRHRHPLGVSGGSIRSSYPVVNVSFPVTVSFFPLSG
jgi:hypothetical protein